MSCTLIRYIEANFSNPARIKNRSRIEIFAQILKAVNGSGGITQTKIMYNALLSYSQTKEYILLLTEKGLLQYDNAMHIFNITQKGLRFLEIYNKIDQTMNGGEHEGGEAFVPSSSSYADK
jgi:predicted transcriptional regulator